MASINYSQILKRSWELTWKNKWLWVYGLVLAVYGGAGGSGGGSSSSGSSSDGFKNLPKDLPQNLPQKTSEVLGQATSLVKEWITHISPQNWVLLGLGILLLILVWVIIAWIIRAWAKGALIQGLQDAVADKPVTLISTSPSGLTALKSLIWFNVISLGLGLAVILGAALIIGGGYLILSFSGVTQRLWVVLSGLVVGLGAIILLVLFAMLAVYADRLIVLHHMAPWAAWKKGLGLSRGNFFPTLVMAIINYAVGCAVGCLGTLLMIVVLGIPAAIVLIPAFKGGFHLPGPAGIITLILIGFSFVTINLLLRGVMVVFNYGTWNLFFQQIVQEENP